MKRLWKIFLVVLIIVIAFYFPMIVATIAQWMASIGFTLPAGFIAGLANIPWWAGAAVGVGLAYVIDPDTTSEIIEDVGEIVGEVGEAASTAVGGVLEGILNNPVVLAVGGGLLLWWLMGADKKKETIVVPSSATELNPGGF